MANRKKDIIVAEKSNTKTTSNLEAKSGSGGNGLMALLAIVIVCCFGVYFYLSQASFFDTATQTNTEQTNTEIVNQLRSNENTGTINKADNNENRQETATPLAEPVKPKENNSATIEDSATNSAYNSGAESPILKFAPDISYILGDDDSEKQLGPYDQEAEKNNEAENILPNEILINKIGNYRLYLADANELIFRFLTGHDYKTQLETVMTIKLPESVEEVVLLMDQYLTLKKNSITSKIVFPADSKPLEKFIKITRNTPEYDRQIELEHKIKKDLHILKTYIYSAELQQHFIK